MSKEANSRPARVGLMLSGLMVLGIASFQNCAPFEALPTAELLKAGNPDLQPVLAGTFDINGGAEFSKSKSVLLRISPELGREVQISEGEVCSDVASWVENAEAIPFEFSAGSGAQQVSVRGRQGGAESDCLTEEITLDTTAPGVQIKTGTATRIQAASLAIEFTASDSVSGIAKTQCQLDQGAWEDCSSPRQLSGLSVGMHIFRVKAEDGAGNVSANAEHAFTYVMTAPSPTPTPTPNPNATPRPGSDLPAIVKIMPLGDSITEGGPPAGYRPYLYQHLIGGGYKLNFVGDYSNGYSSFPDKEHQGVRGWRIDQVANGIETIILRHKPNVVLLGAGGNDITSNYKLDQAPQRLLDLARRINRALPSCYVIVQTRPPRADALDAKVVVFNAEVRKLINAETGVNPRIYLQDNYPLMTKADVYSGDLVHPNDSGYRKLAAGWYSALLKILPKK